MFFQQIRKLEKDGGRQLFWAESLIMTFFMAFGGGILAPFLLGKPPVFFVNDLLVPLVSTVCYRHPARTLARVIKHGGINYRKQALLQL